MCKFDTQFVLCTCTNDTSSDISWEIKRPLKHKKSDSKIIGQINIPEQFKNITSKEFDTKIEEMIKFSELHKARKIELRNVINNIQTELNNRNCFDKEIDLFENDILSLRLDKKLKVWANYIYKKSKWEIHDLFTDTDDFSIKYMGKIKPKLY